MAHEAATTTSRKLDADTMEVSIFPFKMQLLPPEYMEHAAEAKLEDVDATDDE